MKTNKLGNTDLQLTNIGLGTWAIGGPWEYGWGPQDDSQAVQSILRALELGVNWIDTAPVYGCGHAEELIGKALKQTRFKPYIATKCGTDCDKNKKKLGNILAREHILSQCKKSLKRMGIDQIDLYQMHWPQPDKDIEQGWETMAECVEKGWVRHIGVSNFSIEQMERLKGIHPIASLQPPYSMLARETEWQLLEYCAQHNIGVVAYSPLKRGLLTGKFSHEYMQKIPADDHRKKSPEFTEPLFSIYLDVVEKLKPIASRNGRTPAQLAIAWVLRRPEVTAAIVGARKPSQIEETAEASNFEINSEDLHEINELLERCHEQIQKAQKQNI